MQKKLKLEQHAIAQINMLANRLMQRSSLAYTKKFGIGIIEWRVVATLYDHHNFSAQQLTDILGVDKALISRTIKKLDIKGYILVTPDLYDKRILRLNLSEKGEKLYGIASEFSYHRENLLLEELCEKDVEKLFELLKHLSSRINLL